MALTVTQYAENADWFNSASPKTVTGVAWSAGDRVVVVGAYENNLTENLPTNANLTFSEHTSNTATAGESRTWIWSAIAGSAQTGQTISATNSGSICGLAVIVISGGDSVVTNASSNFTESNFSLGVAAGSVVVYIGADFTATTPTKTPATGSGSATEWADTGNGTNYGIYIATWEGTSATTASFGPNNYTSLQIAQSVIEVRSAGPTPYVTQGQNAAITASRSPSLTFGTAPAADDVVVMWPSSTTTAQTITEPSGWSNPLGAGVDVESDSHQICCVYHVVTAAEAAGATTTFTATNLYGANTTGNVVGCVVRNCDPVDPLNIANSTFSSTNTVTPHVLAGLTPTVTDGIMLSAVAKDATGAYSSTPAGWTQITTSNTNQGKWLGYQTALTTANSAISAVNITPSAGDEYASISVVLRMVEQERYRIKVLPTQQMEMAQWSVQNFFNQ